MLGLSWLRKAILRASGHKAMHDEDKIYAETVAELSAEDGTAASCRRPDTRGATASDSRSAFKGVFLEGMEVVLIVISLGAAQHRLGLAALAAGAAVVLVGRRRHLLWPASSARCPRTPSRRAVGVMLTSFGVFWVGEGAGVHWPGGDLAIPVLAGFFVVVYFGHARPSCGRGSRVADGRGRRSDAVMDVLGARAQGLRPLLVGLPRRRHPRARPGDRASSSRWPSCSRGAAWRGDHPAADGDRFPPPQRAPRAATRPGG